MAEADREDAGNLGEGEEGENGIVYNRKRKRSIRKNSLVIALLSLPASALLAVMTIIGYSKNDSAATIMPFLIFSVIFGIVGTIAAISAWVFWSKRRLRPELYNRFPQCLIRCILNYMPSDSSILASETNGDSSVAFQDIVDPGNVFGDPAVDIPLEPPIELGNPPLECDVNAPLQHAVEASAQLPQPDCARESRPNVECPQPLPSIDSNAPVPPPHIESITQNIRPAVSSLASQELSTSSKISELASGSLSEATSVPEEHLEQKVVDENSETASSVGSQQPKEDILLLLQGKFSDFTAQATDSGKLQRRKTPTDSDKTVEEPSQSSEEESTEKQSS